MIDLFPWFDWFMKTIVGAFILLVIIIIILYFTIGRKPDKPKKKQ